jgi:hypothetical protein
VNKIEINFRNIVTISLIFIVLLTAIIIWSNSFVVTKALNAQSQNVANIIQPVLDSKQNV